ncbi:hypothetical protein HX052_17580 [Myroides marinus]|uniref:hypothetical protein n=1 Tax=Myroides marinus TaxID=703342 RepID=UPI0025756FEA|nr:hypothetical protein [Myroides marinus]MDM1370075.1 hypothetical protein [Myroides marinus]MDM1372447.1 hypothetical protein [Myroides marinus]MDM1377063.1 hypothetical protein [Myroides marinus]MDM1384558.1 hypothetical protein [Myroides marinus]MDM1391746.1 hypothetical protein [Myroides marinus]
MKKLLLFFLLTTITISCHNKENNTTIPTVEIIGNQETNELQEPQLNYNDEIDDDYIEMGLGENLDEFYAYVDNIYMKDNVVYVDIDLVEIQYKNIDERVIVNNNSRIRTYIVDNSSLIVSNNCKDLTPSELYDIRKILLDDKSILMVGQTLKGKMISINFGCYG